MSAQSWNKSRHFPAVPVICVSKAFSEFTLFEYDHEVYYGDVQNEQYVNSKVVNNQSYSCKHKPDLAIVDILMPGKEGIETMGDIRDAAPMTKFIAISGGGIGHSRLPLDMAKALGADATLAKPFRPAELAETVDRVLKATRAETRRGA